MKQLFGFLFSISFVLAGAPNLYAQSTTCDIDDLCAGHGPKSNVGDDFQQTASASEDGDIYAGHGPKSYLVDEEGNIYPLDCEQAPDGNTYCMEDLN